MRYQSRAPYIALLCLAALLNGCAAPRKVILAGSTSVQPFAELWSDEYAKQRPEVRVIVQGGGSSAGVEAALTGTAGIGMSSRQLKPEEEFGTGSTPRLKKIVVAYDAIAVIVNARSPLTGISSAELREIFSGRTTSFQGRRLTVVTREEGSGTRASFEEAVMKSADGRTALPISNSALVQDSNGAVREIVAGDPNAIGYISLGLVDRRVRALALDGVVPGEAAVHAGTYRLVRPFIFLVRPETKSPDVREFIDFCLSPEGQEIVARRGLLKVFR